MKVHLMCCQSIFHVNPAGLVFVSFFNNRGLLLLGAVTCALRAPLLQQSPKLPQGKKIECNDMTLIFSH